MTFRLPLRFAFALCIGAAATSTVAQLPAPAAEFAIKGFRHADFGIDETAARAAIRKDFPGIRVAEATNTAEGTRLLQVSLPRLEPGPGPATVTYIFGARSKALTTVKLAWVLPSTATAADRAALLAAGAELTAYFQNQRPRPPRMMPPQVTSPGSISLFTAADRRNAAVEITARGVATGPAPGPATSGPAMLLVTYIADARRPDTATPAR